MKLDAAWATDVGRVRQGNEDSLLVDESLGVFAVADGMGGHRGGEVASSTAIEAVRAALANGLAIDAAIREANTAIRERAAGDPEVTGMGTTFTAIVPLEDSSVLIGHVGDSRAYLVRGDELVKLTVDHSLVQDLVREGRITADQAEVHPQRSIITRALGIEPDVDVDVYTLRVRDGDRLVICSDGLTDMVNESEVHRLAKATDTAEAASHALVDAANAAGGVDNITVVVLDVTEVGDVDSFVDHIESDESPALVEDETPSSTPDPVTPTRPRRQIGRQILRFLVVLGPLAIVIGVAWFVIERRATHTWFVSAENGEVVIMRGVPGGLLWYEPNVDERTGLMVGTLTEGDRALVQSGHCERGSIEEARVCVDRLEANRRPADS